LRCDPPLRSGSRSCESPCPEDEQALGADLQEGDDGHEHDHLGQAGLGPVLDEGVEHAQGEGGDHRAPKLAQPTDHHHEEGVDDVVGAQRGADRSEQGEGDTRHAGQS
jgi:hypothetical protein